MNLVSFGDERPKESSKQGSTFDGARFQNANSAGHAPFSTLCKRAFNSSQKGTS